MFDLFLQFFPMCALLCTCFFLLADTFTKADAHTRRLLKNRIIGVKGNMFIFQEDGKPLCEVDILKYFDELPVERKICAA